MSDQDEFLKSLKENADDGLIKVHFELDAENGGPAGESVWATPIGKKFAKISNIPFFVTEVSIDDIVEIEPNDESLCKEFVRVVTKGTFKYFVKYNIGKNEESLLDIFSKICSRIKEAEGKIEGAAPGFCMVAFPVALPKSKARKILMDTANIEEFDLTEE
jgi:hypothetical protein